MSRKNEEGLEIIREHPDCECDGNVITLWDCECPECSQIAAENRAMDPAEDCM